jgi:hypothetical protein
MLHYPVNMAVNTVGILNNLLHYCFCLFVFIRMFFIFFSQEFRPPFSVWDAKRFDIISLTYIRRELVTLHDYKTVHVECKTL